MKLSESIELMRQHIDIFLVFMFFYCVIMLPILLIFEYYRRKNRGLKNEV